MARNNDRENLTEMEQIHRGLEAFLQKEVYEEYEAAEDAGAEEYGRDAEREGYEYEEYGDEGYENGEYGDEGYEDEGYGDEEYEDGEYGNRKYEEEESVRAAMGRKSMSQTGNGGKSRSTHTQGGGKSRADRQGGGKSRANRQHGGKSKVSKGRDNGREQPVKKKKHKILRRFLAVVVVLLLALTALWYVSVSYLYDKVEYAPTDILAEEPMKEEGVTNILLIGNDSRENGGDGRSDAMILVSISNRTQTIYLTSLLRDIYVEIPGHESNRLNAAYAFGGPELLLETIKQNFDIEVNRYVQVNFQAFANLIDAVGGVDLELTNEEVQLVNAYLNEYNMLENRPMDTDYLPADASGLLHLNGPQALAYSRNRYIGSDFGRTQRQRKILEAVFHQLPSSVLTNADDMIDGILPNLTTNISRSECYLLSLDAPKLLTYELVQASIPIEGSYQNATIRKMSVLQVDFEKNKEFIRTQIYGEDGEQ